MSDVPEQIQEVVAETAEAVGDAAIDFAEVTRQLSRVKVQYAALGYAIGAATGAFIAFKLAYSRAETRFSQIADEEIAEMREHYQAKMRAAEGEAQKANLEELVADRGYVSNDDERPPMAVTPPESVVEAAADAVSEETTRVAPPVSAKDAPETNVRNVFKDADETAQVADSWDHHAELRRRSPDIPYVIHVDEKDEFEDYSELTLTYYDADDVLCNDRDEIIPPAERDALIGEGSLNRFGHGSNDPAIVFIRNDKLELLIEVIRSPNSYAEEVHGFAHGGYSRNLERMRQREREELDDDG